MLPRFSSRTVPQGCIPFRECKAKTCPDGSYGTSVFDHCRYAGYVAEALLALLPENVRKLLPPETPFFVSLHDIGKVSPEYEIKYFELLVGKFSPEWLTKLQTKKLRGELRGHASIGAISLITKFGLFPDETIVSSVASHHGFSPPQKSLRANDDLGDTDSWQTERELLVAALAQEFGASSDSIAKLQCRVDLLAGITCVADWIASDEEFFRPDMPSLSSDEGRVRAAYAVTRCGFARASFRHGLSFRDVFGFDPYPSQQTFIDAVSLPGVYVLEAPMGMGKTEAALYAAYRLVEAGCHSGIYFALPTRLTSDRIHERVEQFLKAVSSTPTAVKLAHGQAWLKEFESGREGSDRSADRRPPPWFNPSKRGLLFPFAVGTIDQALLSVLNVKHSFVRSFALAGKVVVLDEVHSYDAYTGTLLDELVARLRELGCTVIVLSATLTDARRKALLGENAPNATGYPLLTELRASGEAVVRALEPPPSREVRLRWIDAASEPPLAAAVAKARAGCNVLCIANTVATAQEWFRTLKNEVSPDEVPIGLLHAKFTAHDRDRIEDEWMKKLGKPSKKVPDPRPHGSVLIATQIVEQSVDIDADWMLSELAPADMLLQRLGRLWRHERPNRPVDEPELAIVCARMPADDLSDVPSETKELETFFGHGVWVYAPYVLLRTLETLRGRESIRIPDDIRPILEKVYSDESSRTNLHNALKSKMEAKKDEMRGEALAAQNTTLPTGTDDEKATRYNSRPYVSLLIVRSLDAVTGRAVLLDGTEVTIKRFERDFKVTKALYRNLVQVAPNDVLRTVDGETKMILSQHFFASDMPRICDWDARSGALSLHGSETNAGYAYHPAYGAYRRQDESQDDSIGTATNEASFSEKNVHLPPALDSGIISEPEGDFVFENDNDW